MSFGTLSPVQALHVGEETASATTGGDIATVPASAMPMANDLLTVFVSMPSRLARESARLLIRWDALPAGIQVPDPSLFGSVLPEGSAAGTAFASLDELSGSDHRDRRHRGGER
jgi:hypothetical protein